MNDNRVPKSIRVAFSEADTTDYPYPPTPDQALQIVRDLAEKPGVQLSIFMHKLN